MAATKGWSKAAAAISDPNTNPFAYDVTRLTKVDPRLLHYREVARLRSLRPDARRLALGAGDSVYLAAGKYVTALDASGSTLVEIALDRPARCLALTPQNDIYIGVQDHVEVFDAKGRRQAVWPAPGPRAWLTAVVLTPAAAFVADAGNRAIWRCDLSGKVIARIGEKDKNRNVPGFIVPSPFFDAALHRDGLLRVTNPGRHRVEAYTVEGDFEFAWGKPSAAIDGFCGCCNPIALAFLPDGSIVTCEKGLPRVKVYAVDGTLQSVVAPPESFSENRQACESLEDCQHGGLDVAVDRAGRVCILDRVTAEIRVMARVTESPNPSPSKRSSGM
jgi:hypothetical protein